MTLRRCVPTRGSPSWQAEIMRGNRVVSSKTFTDSTFLDETIEDVKKREWWAARLAYLSAKEWLRKEEMNHPKTVPKRPKPKGGIRYYYTQNRRRTGYVEYIVASIGSVVVQGKRRRVEKKFYFPSASYVNEIEARKAAEDWLDSQKETKCRNLT